jgi:hypothetical protein
VEYPVEFDCAAGCGLSVEEMVWAFQSSVTARPRDSPGPCAQTPDRSFDAHIAPDAPPYRPAGVPVDNPSAGDAPARRIRAVELIPGHAETAAEVWLWHGRVPAVDDDPRLWVSLKSDDWPMRPATARRLAAALLAAAAIADRAQPRPR